MQRLVEKLKGLKGPGTPAGAVKFTFSVPAPVAVEPQPDFSALSIGKRDADQNGPVNYLAACRKEARALSRCTLPVTRRLQVTEDFTRHLVLIATKHIK